MRFLTLKSFLTAATIAACLVHPRPTTGQVLQRVEIPSSFNPVGSGARALGMGGAFIAVADDATAASWNPGGLIQLERPELSLVGSVFARTEDLSFGSAPEGNGGQRVDKESINYMSIALPFAVSGYNMVASVNYQQLYDLSRDWSFVLTDTLDNRTIRYRQGGEIGAAGFAWSVQLSPELSAGISLNIWGKPAGLQTWDETLVERDDAVRLTGEPFTSRTVTRERFRFDGVNANVGILWRVAPAITLGAVFKSPFRADLRKRVSTSISRVFSESSELNTTVSDSRQVDERLDMPSSFGLGCAWRVSDVWTLSADVYRTNWQDFVLIGEDGGRTVPLSGLADTDSDVGPTHQVRIGTEYLLIRRDDVIPLRAGVFYDPAPAEHSSDDFYGISVGAGYVRAGWSLDFVYQYRWGNDVGTDTVLQPLGFREDIREHTVFSSVIVYF